VEFLCNIPTTLAELVNKKIEKKTQNLGKDSMAPKKKLDIKLYYRR